MARIELRNAFIRFVDGYSNTALVNEPTVAPANGDTTLEIDTLGTAGRIPVTSRFTVIGSTRQYTVTADNANETQQLVVDATSGDFRITFLGTIASPVSQQTADIPFNSSSATITAELEALAGIAVGDVLVTGPTVVGDTRTWVIEFQGNFLNTNMGLMTAQDIDLMGGADTAVITLINQGGDTKQITFTPSLATADGIPANNAAITFSGRTLEVKIGDGNLTYTEARELEYVLERGNLDSVREGDQIPVAITLDFIWEFITAITGSGSPTVDDVLKRIGEASAWVSSDSDTCAPYAVDLEVEHDPPCSDEEREFLLFQDFRWDELDHDLGEASVAVTGRANVTRPTVTRVAQ